MLGLQALEGDFRAHAAALSTLGTALAGALREHSAEADLDTLGQALHAVEQRRCGACTQRIGLMGWQCTCSLAQRRPAQQADARLWRRALLQQALGRTRMERSVQRAQHLVPRSAPDDACRALGLVFALSRFTDKLVLAGKAVHGSAWLRQRACRRWPARNACYL